MRITIDNLDGQGALDYSRWISAAGPLTVKRRLNEPSTCEVMLDLIESSLGRPLRKARVVVGREDGTVLFTGYLPIEPELVYAGVGLTGAAYRVTLRATSDEWLLDRQGASSVGAGLGQSGVEVLASLTDQVSAGAFAVTASGPVRSVGVFQPKQDEGWSRNAGALANSVYAAYRVVGGIVELQTAGTVTHALSDQDGTLEPGALQLSQRREMANDVTVSGEIEAAAYIAESFTGDGTTDVFLLATTPFLHGNSDALGRTISDSFDGAVLDRRVWDTSDPGSHMSLTSAGLTLSGGNGFDGQTMLEATDAVELGGTLVLEMGAVQMGAASDGVLCGLYSGDTKRENCLAGYNVRQSGGNTVVVPLISGVEAGTPYTLQSGHRYTLRVRAHCVEAQRVLQTYYAMSGGVVRSFGGGLVGAPVDLVLDLQDLGTSSNTPATVLYDGRVQASPAVCTFVPVNSVQLMGSVGYCRSMRTGSVWITKRSAAGVKTTQLSGSAGEGVDCAISTSGRVTFFAGRIPQAGEMITVNYRSGQRAIARVEDAASVTAEATGGVAGSTRWLGKIARPVARSTVDCESAAAALLSVATDASAGMGGSYGAVTADDIWPGDVLSISRAGTGTNTIAREVTIRDGGAVPEFVTYTVTFASEWADGIGMKTSEAVATDVNLPQTAQTSPGVVLANLQALTLVSASGSALQVDAGLRRRREGGSR